MFDRIFRGAVLLMCFAGSMVENAVATTHDFYTGKTMRIVVGASTGGAFDTGGRMIGGHMGKQIPGNRTW